METPEEIIRRRHDDKEVMPNNSCSSSPYKKYSSQPYIRTAYMSMVMYTGSQSNKLKLVCFNFNTTSATDLMYNMKSSLVFV